MNNNVLYIWSPDEIEIHNFAACLDKHILGSKTFYILRIASTWGQRRDRRIRFLYVVFMKCWINISMTVCFLVLPHIDCVRRHRLFWSKYIKTKLKEKTYEKCMSYFPSHKMHGVFKSNSIVAIILVTRRVFQSPTSKTP